MKNVILKCNVYVSVNYLLVNEIKKKVDTTLTIKKMYTP